MSEYKLTKYGKIHYYENILENPYEIIEMLENSDKSLTDNSIITKWKEWESSDKITVYGYQKMVKSYSKNIIENSTLTYIIQSLTKAINSCSKNYAKENNIDIGYLTNISISKYVLGKGMGPHVDSYDDDRSPILSIVLYLNDDYDGGELDFKNQGVTIKPTAGSLIAFPSVKPYFHESKPIKKGIKYMSPGFWYKKD